MPEPVAQRRVVSRPARVVAPTSVNLARSIFTERAPGPSPIIRSSWEILHGGVEDLLDGRIEPVDLVDEEHVALLKPGQLRGEVAGLGDHRPGGRAEVDAELARHDLRQRRGLPRPGRPDEQHMVERLAPRLGRLDEHAQVFARGRLAGEVGEGEAGAVRNRDRCPSGPGRTRRFGARAKGGVRFVVETR